jgi:hypothetical protein
MVTGIYRTTQCLDCSGSLMLWGAVGFTSFGAEPRGTFVNGSDEGHTVS